MRVEQALSCSQLYLRSLEQSSGSRYESGVQEGVQGAVPMKKGADASPFYLGGGREMHLVLSIWVSSVHSAQSLACRVHLEELIYSCFRKG